MHSQTTISTERIRIKNERIGKKGTTVRELMEQPRPISYMYKMRGVPQGAPTSPILATLALHNSILDRGWKQ